MADILLIDDMAGVRRAVESMLKQAGHTITTAMNGKEGLEMLKRRSFDLVITDMLMPEVDGTEVLFQLRDMSRRPRVIAMSGGGAGVSTAAALRMAQLQADGFLEKPFEKADLVALVERVLAKAA